ncbi:MAG: hydroxyacylglutathione hydrolase [Pseudomonadota bacterium]
MPSLEVELVPALSDNYIYLLFDPETETSGVVDPGEAEPVIGELEKKGRGLDWILATHHHGDHVGGLNTLKSHYSCKVAGPRADARRIPGLDVELADGEHLTFGGHQALVMETPGHTRGHIVFWFEDAQVLFSGDTLFALGCGRLFEDSAEAMWRSLEKIRELPDSAQVYCGHEYTQSNARFAVTVDPDNEDLQKRVAEINAQRGRNEPTIPFKLGLDKATNPFLRPDDPDIRRSLKMETHADKDVFAEIRSRKDRA